MKLLTRDQFREAVFERDGHKCVFCEKPAVDAHHILERRLWPDGGYYLNNGASVCEAHHLACERTLIPVETVRTYCGITKIIVPPHMYEDHIYDKWGNGILENGKRTKGELFFDPSVQKVLEEGGALSCFVDYVKYPRTHHVPWSPGIHSDDRVIPSMGIFSGRRVIVTEKMDGENTSVYTNYLHARSVDSRNHPSRNWVKNFCSNFQADIPPGWRVCGENLFAEHSVKYSDLPSYFLGFSIWTESNVCLSWDETLEWFELFGVTPAPVLYDGEYDEKKIKALWDTFKWDISEGYVIRIAENFHYRNFKDSVAKFVRDGHIQTTKHWMHGQPVRPNGLAE